MENTETAGGSRYSSGKPAVIWSPTTMAGHYARMWNMGELEYYFVDEFGPGGALECVASELAHSLGMGTLPDTKLSAVVLAVCGHVHTPTPAPHVNPVWIGLLEVGRVSSMGARKYAPRDWALGQSYQTLLNSAFRHIIKACALGWSEQDSESKLPHVAHAAWNLCCLDHFRFVEKDDALDNFTIWNGVSAGMMKEAGLSPDDEDASGFRRVFTPM